jgi:flagellar hook assembly protein FlgD
VLYQNYPNPFNPTTVISYQVPAKTHVTIDIFDCSGRRVVRLVDAMRGAGRHRVEWNGRNHSEKHVASGVYFCRLATESGRKTKKMVVLR